MPCCNWLLSVAASSSNRTPAWLHRLHAKRGLSIPSNLRFDDFYGQPPPPPPPPLAILPPPPSSSAANPPTNPKPPRYPSRSNPSSASKTNPPQPQPQPPLSLVISDLFAVPSAPRSSRAIKPFRKQLRPLPLPDNNSPPSNKDAKDKAKSKAKKRRRAPDAEGVQRSRTDVTVIDSSTDGWKAAKVLIRRGTVWKIRDREDSGISEPNDLNKGKRRAGLVDKILRDKQKGKDVVLLGDNRASNEDIMKESDDVNHVIQVLKRPRCSDPEGQSAKILLLQSTPYDISEGGSRGI